MWKVLNFQESGKQEGWDWGSHQRHRLERLAPSNVTELWMTMFTAGEVEMTFKVPSSSKYSMILSYTSAIH